MEPDIFEEMDELMHEEPEHKDPAEPFRKAKQQREQSAAIIAEHDNLLADMLFELTLTEMGM